MGFPHVFHVEGLCLQLLVLMTVYPCFGHMSLIKGGPESAVHDLIWLCPCWETTAPPCRLPRKCSLVLFLQPSLTAAKSACSHTVTYCKTSTVLHLHICISATFQMNMGGKTFPWLFSDRRRFITPSQVKLILHTSLCPCLHRESVSHVQTTNVLWWATMLTSSLWLMVFQRQSISSTQAVQSPLTVSTLILSWQK